MKSILILLLFLVYCFGFESDKKEVTGYVNMEAKKVTIKNGHDFYFKCIDNYQWVQFVSCYTDDGNIMCTEKGLPIQQFERTNTYSINDRRSVPVYCNQ